MARRSVIVNRQISGDKFTRVSIDFGIEWFFQAAVANTIGSVSVVPEVISLEIDEAGPSSPALWSSAPSSPAPSSPASLSSAPWSPVPSSFKTIQPTITSRYQPLDPFQCE